MLTLGIETSCDETAAAVVADGRSIRSNVVVSSVPLHAPYGGVVPEIACRYHVEAITRVIREALLRGGCRLQDIELVAVTSGPGLLGALLVGVSATKALALALRKPCIGVNHLQAHAEVGVLDGAEEPYVSLIVSGGHTSLVSVRPPDRWQLLGQTVDDAAGEAFDKVASLLGLGYPGGPAIQQVAEEGNPSAVAFPRARCRSGSFDFSFSGLKTAVLYYLRSHEPRATSHELQAANNKTAGTSQFATRGSQREDCSSRLVSRGSSLDPRFVSDVAASFQEAVVDVLVRQTMAACYAKRAKRLVLGGGVSANRRLRERMAEACQERGITLFVPEPSLCVDNGAMVAVLGDRLYRRGWRSDLMLAATPDALVTAMLAARDAN